MNQLKNFLLYSVLLIILCILLSGCAVNDVQFVQAIEKHDKEAESIIANMEDVNRTLAPFHNETALHIAVRHHNMAAIRLLIQRGADVHKLGLGKYTLLYYAMDKLNYFSTERIDYDVIEKTNYDIVELLLDKGVDVNAAGDYNWTPLWAYISRSHRKWKKQGFHLLSFLRTEKQWSEDVFIEIPNHLKKYGRKLGATHNEEGKYGAKLRKMFKAHCKTLLLLIERGAKPDIPSDDGQTPLMLTAEYGFTIPFLLLFTKGANIHAVDKSNTSVFGHALKPANLYIANILMDQGVDLNVAPSGVSNVALVLYRLKNTRDNNMKQYYIQFTKKMLRGGAKDTNSKALLWIGEHFGEYIPVSDCFALAKMVIPSCTDPNCTDFNGTPVLFSFADRYIRSKGKAQYKEYIELVKLLLKKGANVNLPYDGLSNRWYKGESILMHAAASKNKELVKLFLQYGAKTPKGKDLEYALVANKHKTKAALEFIKQVKGN